MTQLRYEFHEQCPRHKSIYPIHYHGLSVFNEKDQKIGYITTQSVLKETWQDFERDPCLFANKVMGVYGIYDEDDEETPLIEKSVKLSVLLEWLERNRLVKSSDYQGLTEEELKVFEPEWKELLKNSEQFQLRWKQKRSIVGIDQPVISYIRVDAAYQKQGIAIEMYKQMALAFEKKGMSLYSSVDQTPAAEKCWEKMKKLGWVEEFSETERLPRLKISGSSIRNALQNKNTPTLVASPLSVR